MISQQGELLSQVYLTLQGHDGACSAAAANTSQTNLGLKSASWCYESINFA